MNQEQANLHNEVSGRLWILGNAEATAWAVISSILSAVTSTQPNTEVSYQPLDQASKEVVSQRLAQETIAQTTTQAPHTQSQQAMAANARQELENIGKETTNDQPSA